MSGILTAFFDFLSYPMVTLGVPLIMYLAQTERRKEEDGISVYCKEIFLCSVSWGIGYIGMWSGKWIAATCFTDENVILNAFNQIKIRGGNVYKEETYTWIGTIMVNIESCNKTVLLAVFCFLIFVTVIYRIRTSLWIKKMSLYRIGAIGVVSTYPFIWYGLTRNHSSIHGWFMTWRELAISVFGIVTILCMDMQKRGDTDNTISIQTVDKGAVAKVDMKAEGNPK